MSDFNSIALLILNRLRCAVQLSDLQTEEPQRAEENSKQHRDRTEKEPDEQERVGIQRRILDMTAMEDRLKRD